MLNGRFPLPIRLTRSSRSPKFSDQARPTAVHDFFPTATRPYTTIHDSSTTSTRQPPRSLLDPYTIFTRPTQPLLDLYSISTRLDRPGRTGVVGVVKLEGWRGYGCGFIIKKCSSRAGFSAFSRYPWCCRCDLFVFVAAYERLPDLHDLFEGSCRGRVRSCKFEKRSGTWSSSDRVADELIWTTDWIGIAMIGKRSGMGRIEVELIGYWSAFFFIPTKLDLYTIVFRSTRPLFNQYPIISRWLLERLASRSLFEFFEHVQNFRVGCRSDA